MPTTRDLDAELDERLQRFAAKGMSRAGMLAQLNLAGYPIAKLRERFPEFSDVAFGLTPPIDSSQSSTSARDAERSSPSDRRSGHAVDPSVEARSRRSLPRDVPAEASRERPQPRAELQAAEEGRSPSTMCR